jgi:hypothetical protein
MHGGKRENAGRKKTIDKIKQIYLGIKQSKIDYHGGEQLLKEKIKKFIDKHV